MQNECLMHDTKKEIISALRAHYFQLVYEASQTDKAHKEGNANIEAVRTVHKWRVEAEELYSKVKMIPECR